MKRLSTIALALFAITACSVDPARTPTVSVDDPGGNSKKTPNGKTTPDPDVEPENKKEDTPVKEDPVKKDPVKKDPVAEPIHCMTTAWSSWSECSAQCGGGEQTRTRTIAMEAQFGGTDCGALEETRTCGEQACPPEVGGYDARVVEYSNGAFVQLNSRDWVENNPDGPHRFIEMGRDEWSVYLQRTDGALSIQLDMWTNEVKYTPAGGFQVVLYEITSASSKDEAAAETTGWSASRAYYGSGSFSQLTADVWVEHLPGERYEYLEIGRDEWSVYLQAKNFSIQLDFWTDEVLYSTGGEQSALFPIEDGETINGWNVREVSVATGTFRQTDAYEWVELDDNGKAVFYFEETVRDEWSAYLYDASRQVSLRLDLWTQKVHYSDPNQAFDLYSITGVM